MERSSAAPPAAAQCRPPAARRTKRTPHRCLLPLQVHAHGGQLLQEGSNFYWVGTSQKKYPWWTSEEINVYSSSDLVHWRLRCGRRPFLPAVVARLPVAAAWQAGARVC